MIDNREGIYFLFCDICGEKADESFFDFYEAVDYEKQHGWKSQRHNSGWEDVCPGCWGLGGGEK